MTRTSVPASATHTASATPPDREAVCRRCGASCHVAVPAGEAGTVVVPGLHCMFLEKQGDRFGCTVYAERFARAPWCHTAEEAQPLGYLATDCPYGPNDEGKVVVSEARMVALFPTLLRNLRAWGVPTYIHREALLREVESRTRRRFVLEPWPGDPERLRLRPVGFSQPLTVAGAGHKESTDA